MLNEADIKQRIKWLENHQKDYIDQLKKIVNSITYDDCRQHHFNSIQCLMGNINSTSAKLFALQLILDEKIIE